MASGLRVNSTLRPHLLLRGRPSPILQTWPILFWAGNLLVMSSNRRQKVEDQPSAAREFLNTKLRMSSTVGF
jgi:hypothetical protein